LKSTIFAAHFEKLKITTSHDLTSNFEQFKNKNKSSTFWHSDAQKLQAFVAVGWQTATVLRFGTCVSPKSKAFDVFGMQIATVLRFRTCDSPK
jgi:hypothetical protein